MGQGTIVWLVVLGVLALLFALTLRRMSVLVGRTRDLERFQRGVEAIERRLAAIADPFVSQLDELRRRSGDPGALATALPPAQDVLRALAAEGRSLRAPAALAQPAGAFLVELERAVRALDLVEHGLDALLADRGGRDLEAQTSLKRGALNLRHAREAATRLAGEIRRVRPADLRQRGGSGPAVAAGSTQTYLADPDLDPDRR